MQIKKFKASDTAEALRMIRKEFGSRAVILSTKDVEVGSGVFGFRKKYGVEVTAATDADTPKDQLEPGTGFESKAFGGRGARNSISTISPKGIKNSKPTGGGMSVSRVGRIRPAKLRGGFSRKADPRMQFFSLYKELQDQGVQEHIAMDLVKELGRLPSLKGSFRSEDLKQGVSETFRKMGAMVKPIRVARGEQKIAAMVGPTGVGKTTTIAKLAAMGGLKHGRKLGMITLDDKKIGAIAELGVYSKILDVPMEVASTRGQLERAIHHLRKKDIILIDTPGISRNENALFRRVQDLLQSVKPLETHLLLSATTREKDFAPLFDRFKSMDIQSFIFTRLDDSTEYGHLMNQLILTGIPVSYFANGPQVPENIEVATLDRLVKLMLKKNHARTIAAPVKPRRAEKRERRLTYGPYLEKSYAYS